MHPEGGNSMTGLKLSKLPDRTPVKIAIIVSPELYHDLRRYADLYRVQFGQAEPVTELIPYMLANFLDSDRGFAKARKDGMIDTTALFPDEPAHRRRRGPAASSSPSTVNGEA
jgi:hypothetical protein